MYLLEVKDINYSFKTSYGNKPTLKSLSFNLYPGEIVALVGESGCGKSITAAIIMRLMTALPSHGQIIFEGKNLLELPEKSMRNIRGKKISMIFQDPLTSLNPTLKIGSQMMEGLEIPRHEKKTKAIQMLLSVGIAEPQKRIHQYPHQLSGGMRQRVMIAMAMSLSPQLLIADEPTTSLDVTIQMQILELMKTLQAHSKMTILLITHDLRIAGSIADRILVMHEGQIVESGTIDSIYKNPIHSHTKKLLSKIV